MRTHPNKRLSAVVKNASSRGVRVEPYSLSRAIWRMLRAIRRMLRAIGWMRRLSMRRAPSSPSRVRRRRASTLCVARSSRRADRVVERFERKFCACEETPPTSNWITLMLKAEEYS
eukprot:9027672-Pyramimonas_sp.AAC.2